MTAYVDGLSFAGRHSVRGRAVTASGQTAAIRTGNEAIERKILE
jgi:hypothetical protein